MVTLSFSNSNGSNFPVINLSNANNSDIAPVINLNNGQGNNPIISFGNNSNIVPISSFANASGGNNPSPVSQLNTIQSKMRRLDQLLAMAGNLATDIRGDLRELRGDLPQSPGSSNPNMGNYSNSSSSPYSGGSNYSNSPYSGSSSASNPVITISFDNGSNSSNSSNSSNNSNPPTVDDFIRKHNLQRRYQPVVNNSNNSSINLENVENATFNNSRTDININGDNSVVNIMVLPDGRVIAAPPPPPTAV